MNITYSQTEPRYFRENLPLLMERYEGEYVVLVGTEVIAHNKNGKRAYDMARKQYPKEMIFLAQVPRKELAIL